MLFFCLPINTIRFASLSPNIESLKKQLFFYKHFIYTFSIEYGDVGEKLINFAQVC